MASQFQQDCPHCTSKNAGFKVAYQWSERGTDAISSVLGICGVCNSGLVLTIRNLRGISVKKYSQGDFDFLDRDERIIRTYPDSTLNIPEDCPEGVQKFYAQGLINLAGGNWDAAGAMFRKSLDVATKIIAPDLKDKSLFHRINSLVDTGHFTPALGEWSHELRIDGNEAVHDEDPETADDANSMQKFAEAFLRYSFTLPNLVARNRAKREPAVD